MNEYVFLYILLNSLVWGMTNPLLKYYGSASFEEKEDSPKSFLNQIFNQIISLFKNYKFVITQLINWCGSIMFVLILGHTNLTT